MQEKCQSLTIANIVKDLTAKELTKKNVALKKATGEKSSICGRLIQRSREYGTLQHTQRCGCINQGRVEEDANQNIKASESVQNT